MPQFNSHLRPKIHGVILDSKPSHRVGMTIFIKTIMYMNFIWNIYIYIYLKILNYM